MKKNIFLQKREKPPTRLQKHAPPAILRLEPNENNNFTNINNTNIPPLINTSAIPLLSPLILPAPPPLPIITTTATVDNNHKKVIITSTTTTTTSDGGGGRPPKKGSDDKKGESGPSGMRQNSATPTAAPAEASSLFSFFQSQCALVPHTQ